MNLDKLYRLDKDELRWNLQDREEMITTALGVLIKATDLVKNGDWNPDASCDVDKLEIYYNAIKEAIRLLS